MQRSWQDVRQAIIVMPWPGPGFNRSCGTGSSFDDVALAKYVRFGSDQVNYVCTRKVPVLRTMRQFSEGLEQGLGALTIPCGRPRNWVFGFWDSVEVD